MSDTANNTSKDQKKKEDDLAETNRTLESENENDDSSPAAKTAKKEKEKGSKPVKKVQKKEKSEDEANESDENEEDDDEEEEEEEKKVGLLDLPLEVSGSRERKKVERLEIGYPVQVKEKKTDILEGSGDKLGDSPLIENQIQKNKTDNLKPLHRLLFNRPGTVTEIKRNIRRFNGFPFDKDSPDYEKKKNVLDKMTESIFKQICNILTLERKGTKDEVVARVMDFLLCPKFSEEHMAKGKRKLGSKADKKKSKMEKTKSKGNTAKKTKSKMTRNEKNSENEVESGGESEKEEESDKEEDDGSEKKGESGKEDDSSEADEKPKKKAAPKREKKKPVKQKNSKQESKSAKSNKQQTVDEDEDDDDDSSDNEPLLKKSKQPPTDDELKSLIKSILDGANLEEITMKTVCKQVYGKYPEFDLSDRKEFIKMTVRSIIS